MITYNNFHHLKFWQQQKKSSHIRPTPAHHLIIPASSREVSMLIGLGRPILFVNPAVFTAFLTNSIGAETFMHSFLRLSTYGSLSILPVIYAKSLSIALSHKTWLVFVNRLIRVKLDFIHPTTTHNMLIFKKFDNTSSFILIKGLQLIMHSLPSFILWICLLKIPWFMHIRDSSKKSSMFNWEKLICKVIRDKMFCCINDIVL